MALNERNPISVNKQQILNAISAGIELPGVSRGYLLGLMLTAVGILLLSLLYVSFITLILGSLLWLGFHANVLMNTWPFPVKVLVVVVACLCGISLILGLVKPFLAQTLPARRPRPISRDAEPFLYEYVFRLCDVLKSPRPSLICVVCDTNASAELQYGWLALFGARRVVLNLGLPLVSGMSLRQFTGVVAHELGHFTQRTGMRLWYFVRSTTQWFESAASERDSIDIWLLTQCATLGLLTIPCYFVRGMFCISRRLLATLANAGTTISCLMSREMEFNADRFEVRTVGTRTFTDSTWRMRQLSIAHQSAFRDVSAFYAEGRLPDDMIALSTANISFLTPNVNKRLRKFMLKTKTQPFDSHPADRDRIESARKDNAHGIERTGPLSDKTPATILFGQFERLCKSVTLQFYEEAFSQKISPRLLHPVGKLLERQQTQIEAKKALKRYFQTEIPPLRPLPIAPQAAEVPDNVSETVVELKAARERMIAELSNYRRLVPRYQTAEETLLETIAAQSLAQAGLPFDPAEHGIKEANPEFIADKHARAKEGVTALAGKLLPFEAEAGNRLSFALQLLQVPEIVQKIPDGDDLQLEILDLLPAARYVSRLISELPSLRIVYHRLLTCSDQLHDGLATQKRGVIEQQLQNLRIRLGSIQREMGTHLYPLDHADATTTFQQFALPVIPPENDLKGLVNVTSQMQSRMVTVQLRLFARMAQAAEKVEAAVGLPPLPEPEDEP